MEMHSSLTKAVELLGFGRDALRCILVDDAYGIDVDKLRIALESDLKSGEKSICVIGIAESTKTGSIEGIGRYRLDIQPLVLHRRRLWCLRVPAKVTATR